MIRVLTLLLCLLAGTVAAEVFYYSDAATPGPNVVAAPPITVPRTSPPNAGHTFQPNQWLAVVAARPLFEPNRRPLAAGVPADAAVPRLSGIVASSTDAVAIFQASDGPKPVVVRLGDQVGGWRVSTVTADAVTLRKTGAMIRLTPQFQGSLTGAMAREAAKPPPTRWEQAADTGVLRARWSNPQLQP